MPTTVLSRQRSWIAILTVLAMVASFMAVATPVQAELQKTSATCPSTIPSAGFTDLGGLEDATVQAIDCLASYGITTGTTATMFSPNNSVPRWQMALLLTRSATAMGVALGDGSDEGFTDISGLDAATEKAINQLVQLGVTKGTSATTFSPNDNVTRLQMALFLTRLATAAGLTLGDGSDQGFTDIDGLDAATQTAINQTVQLGISDGTSTTMFSPLSDTLRWHMALFLTRTLAADGVSAASGFIVISATRTDTSTDIMYADSDQGKKVTAKTTTSDTFFVDGRVATQGAFLASAGICDLVSVTSGSYSLTNKACSKYTTGVIDEVDIDDQQTYAIVEPITGTPLNTVDYDGMFTVHTTDGAAVSQAGFEEDLQAGDMVTSTGTGVNAANIRTLALVNVTVSGKADECSGRNLRGFAVRRHLHPRRH